ncbi:hypothetical protein [Acinetobacter haemolyticus]|uniref:hypothetical protein n=1 Tax=Acinetobacter haemolyticus TaxID=29430 RepID=UPI000F738A05|nr:hypothetical protein [Acinetobacter haemolyticus]RSN77916.1 hypothetical protein EA769_03595 [Acinetobacter haemolyticus]
MATLSKADKDYILEKLNSQLSMVYLKCDENKVSLTLERHKMKLVIGIYVNHEFRGDWLFHPEKHPESKYLPIKRISKYAPSAKQRVIKTFGKRKAYKLYPDLDEVIERPWLYFNTARSALNHLLKVSESIEVIKETVPHERLSKIA